MVLIPMVMNKLETGGLFKRFPRAPAPVQVAATPPLYHAVHCSLSRLGWWVSFLPSPRRCAARYSSRRPRSERQTSNQNFRRNF